MLKLKTLFSAVLLTLSVNTFAFCVHNHTYQSIYVYSPSTRIEPSKISPDHYFCTKKGEPSFGYEIYIYIGKTEKEQQSVCGSYNMTVKNIDVLQSGNFARCIFS